MRFLSLSLALSGCYIITTREICEHDRKVGAKLSEKCQDMLGVSSDSEADADADVDSDADSDADSDSDADTDTFATGETGTWSTETGDTSVLVIETGDTSAPIETADTGVYLGQLCVEVTAPVVGTVNVYVFETNLNDMTFWVDPVAVPVIPNSVPFTSGDAASPICGDMGLVPYSSGHTLLVLATYNDGAEHSAVTGNAAIGYTSSVQSIALSGAPLVCVSTSNFSVSPYAYTSCTL